METKYAVTYAFGLGGTRGKTREVDSAQECERECRALAALSRENGQPTGWGPVVTRAPECEIAPGYGWQGPSGEIWPASQAVV